LNYYNYGPFDIPKMENGLISNDRNEIRTFWEDVERDGEVGLSDAVGCYMFGVRAGKGSVPWYIGLAEKQSYKVECFSPHKLNHFNNAIAKKKVTPILLFIARCTSGDRFSKPSKNGYTDIRILENMLIGLAVKRNPDLLNIKGTKVLRDMVVPGIINTQPGGQSASTLELRTILNN